jgi:hypothetical protein
MGMMLLLSTPGVSSVNNAVFLFFSYGCKKIPRPRRAQKSIPAKRARPLADVRTYTLDVFLLGDYDGNLLAETATVPSRT